MNDRLIEETTERLFQAVHDVLVLAGSEPPFVVHALLAYETLDKDGEPYTDFVVSNAMTLTNTMGFGQMIQARSERALFEGE